MDCRRPAGTATSISGCGACEQAPPIAAHLEPPPTNRSWEQLVALMFDMVFEQSLPVGRLTNA
jgi:hypothetical protein